MGQKCSPCFYSYCCFSCCECHLNSSSHLGGKETDLPVSPSFALEKLIQSSIYDWFLYEYTEINVPDTIKTCASLNICTTCNTILSLFENSENFETIKTKEKDGMVGLISLIINHLHRCYLEASHTTGGEGEEEQQKNRQLIQEKILHTWKCLLKIKVPEHFRKKMNVIRILILRELQFFNQNIQDFLKELTSSTYEEISPRSLQYQQERFFYKDSLVSHSNSTPSQNQKNNSSPNSNHSGSNSNGSRSRDRSLSSIFKEKNKKLQQKKKLEKKTTQLEKVNTLIEEKKKSKMTTTTKPLTDPLPSSRQLQLRQQTQIVMIRDIFPPFSVDFSQHSDNYHPKNNNNNNNNNNNHSEISNSGSSSVSTPNISVISTPNSTENDCNNNNHDEKNKNNDSKKRGNQVLNLEIVGETGKQFSMPVEIENDEFITFLQSMLANLVSQKKDSQTSQIP